MPVRHPLASLRAAMKAGAPAAAWETPVMFDSGRRVTLHLTDAEGVTSCGGNPRHRYAPLSLRAAIESTLDGDGFAVCTSCTGPGRRTFDAELGVLADAGERLAPLLAYADRLELRFNDGDYDRPVNEPQARAAWRLLWLALVATRPSYADPKGLHLDCWAAGLTSRHGQVGRWVSDQLTSCRARVDKVSADIGSERAHRDDTGRTFPMLVAFRFGSAPNAQLSHLFLGQEPVGRIPDGGHLVFSIAVPPGYVVTDLGSYYLGPDDGWNREQLAVALPAAQKLRDSAPEGSPLSAWPQALALTRDLGLIA